VAEMQRLFRFFGLVSYRHRVNEGYPDSGPVAVSAAAERIGALLSLIAGSPKQVSSALHERDGGQSDPS